MKTLIPKLVGALINCIGFFNASYASKLALKLFSKPRSGQLTSSANLFLESAKEREREREREREKEKERERKSEKERERETGRE